MAATISHHGQVRCPSKEFVKRVNHLLSCEKITINEIIAYYFNNFFITDNSWANDLHVVVNVFTLHSWLVYLTLPV